MSVEPETPPAENLSDSAAQTPQPSAGKHKTKGAFGKAKVMKRLSDYFPDHRRKANRQHTFAANSVPKEPDQMADHIAQEQGWEIRNGITETTKDPLESDDDAAHQPSELEEGEDGFKMP